MDIKFTTKDLYPELVSWWKWHRFPAPSIDMLPNSLKDGIVISKNGVNICAGFLYRTPSSFCWLEYIVSNPEVKDKKLRAESLELLINSIIQLAQKMGFKLIFTSVKNENLIKKYVTCGFVIGTKTTEMIRVL